MTALQCPTCRTEVPGHSRYCLSCGSQVSEPSMGGIVAAAPEPHPLLALLRNELAPEYEIERELGRGGMAVVFLAREVELNRAVAIKVLPPEMALAPNVAERFRREARMAASLDHPNIIPVYRVGQAGGVHYMVQKYIEGRSLEAIINSQGALPISVTLMIMRCVTSALAFAHGRGIIHRDIKGANILIDTDGRILVSDFGIARAVEDVALTASGAVVGTPAFMSPEQCSGQPLGPQCDQYSLGIVAFQMVTGTVPFSSPTLPGIMQHHFFTPVPDIAEIREGVPAELSDIIRRALAKKPADRYERTDEMLAAVEAIPFSDAVRKRAEASLRELARGVGIGRISITGPGRGEPTIVGDRAGNQAALTPDLRGGTRATASTTPFVASDPGVIARTGSSRPERAGIVSPRATRVIPVGTGSGSTLHSLPVDVDETTREPGPAIRQHRRLLPWLIMAAIAITLFFVATLLIRQGSGRPAPTGATARANAAAQPFVDRGIAAKARGDMPAAQRELSQALRLAPTHAVGLREMGTLMYGVGNYDLARSFLVHSVRADPTDAAAQQALGCALVRLRREGEAARFFERAGGSARDCR